MAGFEVTLHGRIWVTPEDPAKQKAVGIRPCKRADAAHRVSEHPGAMECRHAQA
jgi:hypothetical protein